MIRSEEEVSVGKRRRVSGRARLRKHVVTEHVQKTVPVQRERVSVEFEPGDEEGEAPAGERVADADDTPRPGGEQR
jgi:stress response protein YsnF